MPLLENKPGLAVTRTASAALTKNRFCKTNATTDTKIDQCGANENALGLIDVSPATGDLTTVYLDGILHCEAGAAVAVGDKIMSDASGRGAPRGSTAGTVYYVQGTALSAAANAGELFSIKLHRYEIKA